MDKVKVGIFFGGSSREREISFAGGRTVYDNLNKQIFEPIPIFIDSKNTLIQLDWEYIYKGTIRDFYPPIQFIPKEDQPYQLYIEHLDLSDAEYAAAIESIGSKLSIDELACLIDVAFLCLHGRTGEDGQIQGLLDYLEIPYTGSDILASAIGMNKAYQKQWMEDSDFASAAFIEIQREEWLNKRVNTSSIIEQLGLPFVIRPSHQGSSIGVSIITADSTQDVDAAVNAALFIKTVHPQAYQKLGKEQQKRYIAKLIDCRSGIGLPAYLGEEVVSSPSRLSEILLASHESELMLRALDSEHSVVCESFIQGLEFSCVVVVDEVGQPFALPPTHIIKGEEVYDYQSKYMPGRSRKVTPIHLPVETIQKIQQECIRLFKAMQFKVYARIDGFFTNEEEVILNDPNTTSGMLPSSFFFHQAAELGLNPSQFITYIIRNSIAERNRYGLILGRYSNLLDRVDALLTSSQTIQNKAKTVGVILGGYSFERHISVESGRNIYEKLASSETYNPVPIFLHGTSASDYKLIKIPINILLKDNADDIKDSIDRYSVHPTTLALRNEKTDILEKYTGSSAISGPEDITSELQNQIDIAFLALHGRPGEDGTVQQRLDQLRIPYNGSGPESASLTIDKFRTLQLLKSHGFEVADQMIIQKEDSGLIVLIDRIESNFNYPFICKPVDDGCSSAVAKIKSKEQLEDYLAAIFRDKPELSLAQREQLGLAHNEEFPQKNRVLVESLIQANGADLFMEITCGMLFHSSGEIEIFEPSEVLAGEEILSLEEKFLAGEGQNITPARFDQKGHNYVTVSEQVKATLKKAAELLDVQGYCRIDAFVRIHENGTVDTIIIEINSLPGMTPATCIFHQTAINGYKPYHFIDKILKFGIHRNNSQFTIA